MSQQSMWPDGRESAACFTFDLDGEEVWIADLQAAGLPGVLSQGTYGPKVAVPLILDILRRHSYASNLMDDIRPYQHPGTSLIELPVHWLLDDAAHFSFSLGNFDKTIRSAAEVRQLWSEEASGIAGLGGIAVWTFHPQVIGRPGRLPLLDELIAAAVADSSVWVARADEIARVAALHQAGPDRARSGRTS